MPIMITSFEALTGLPEFVAYVFIFLFGAILGSFLNVVIHRIPNEESIVYPNSACPKCGTPIKAYDNIPILSWLMLGGKCRSCKAPISPRYPAVELLTAVVFTLGYWQFGLSVFLPVVLVFSATMIALIFIDAEHMILPNVITYPLFVFTLLIRAVYPAFFQTPWFTDVYAWPLNRLEDYPVWLVSLIGAVLGALVGGGFLWLVGEIWKRLRGVDAMGLGDVKMMFGVGALLGWRLTILTIFVAAFTGAVAGILVMLKQKDKDLQAQIPFGIFLGLGSIVSLMFGDRLIGWYINTFIQ